MTKKKTMIGPAYRKPDYMAPWAIWTWLKRPDKLCDNCLGYMSCWHMGDVKNKCLEKVS